MARRWPTTKQKARIFQQVGYEPHSAQWPVHQSKARVLLAAGGERAGKSRVSAAEVLARTPWCYKANRVALVSGEYDETRAEAETVQERELYTLEDVLALTRPAAGDSLKLKRDKATVALMFLSGIRVGALVTLPIQAVDLPGLAIKQWPELGVATKGQKAATTYMLDIPALLDGVRIWDQVVRPALPGTRPWYAPLTYHSGMAAVVLDKRAVASERRRGTVAQGLRELCAAAGLAYLSPHKLRHGHAVHALKRARTIAELKAVSQNLMHADLAVTDGVYGVLADDDVRQTIAALGQAPTLEGDQDSLIAMLETLLAQLKRGT